MRIPVLPLALLLIAATVPERARTWWGHVETLAADAMEGRAAGSEGHRRASDYVARLLARYGLAPAGERGTYFQAVRLEQRSVDAARSSFSIALPGARVPLAIPDDLVVRVAGAPPPARVDAPLVFVGYGFHLPEAGHDDLAGLDLRGKVAVVLDGDPAHLSGALRSHARADRARALATRGAVGMIVLAPSARAGTWPTLARQTAGGGMYLADPALRAFPGAFLSATLHPRAARQLFLGTGHEWPALEALAANAATRQLPRFALPGRLQAVIAGATRPVASRNVVARLPGRDRRLAAEHVVLTAHLDGLGRCPAVDGDDICNGALDNAAGVGALLDIAEQLGRDRARRPRRSLLFVFVTGEERGLLGSRAFATAPTVPRRSLVADLNYDMALPLFPLRSVIVLGADESSLGADARAVGAAAGLPVAADPFPERNSFIRSDQYSFIEEGIPAVAFKFGFAAGTPEAAREAAWRERIYHSPQDDLSQQVFREDEIRLHDFILALALRIADADARPRWNADSFFRRFARD